MNVGAELREARLKAGLSREAVSQRTKIQLAKVEALEENAFERLPEGIYLHGLIRAFATEVGLDGSELVARLQRDDTVAREEHPAANDPADDFVTEAEPDTRTAAPVTDSSNYDAADYMVPAMAPAPFQPTEVAYTASPVGPVDPVVQPPPETRPHIARYVLPVLAIAAAIGLGAFLYDQTESFVPRDEIVAPVVSHDEPTHTADAAPAGREVTPIPDEAVPADRPSTVEHHADTTPEPSVAPSSAAAGGTTAGGSTSTNPAAPDPAGVPPPPAAETTSGGRSNRNARNAPDARKAPDARVAPERITPEARAIAGSSVSDIPGAAVTRTERDAASTGNPVDAADLPDAPNLSGAWTLNTQVESSSVRDYHGLRLGYQVTLQQSGSRVSGEGVKLLENGRRIAATAQTPIVVTGTFDGNRLTLTFTERGRRRDSGGRMILDVLDDGVMRGRFSSSAARSTGTAEARRSQS